jgi:hypothetical protein
MVNFRCWVSASPKPRYRATCLLEADGRGNRGGLFLATKPWCSVTASITRSGLGETVAYGVSPIGLSSSDPGLRRLRRYGLGSGAAWAITVSPEQSKNRSLVRSVRSHSHTSRCLSIGRIKKSAV